MFWYIILMVLFVLLILVALASFIIFIISGCDFPKILIITLISGVFAFGVGCGATTMERANTTTNTDVVQMEITKCDITSVCLNDGSIEQNCYITVGNKYLVEVEAEEYAELNVGDIVMVEITTKTRFGKVQEPTMVLKG